LGETRGGGLQPRLERAQVEGWRKGRKEEKRGTDIHVGAAIWIRSNISSDGFKQLRSKSRGSNGTAEESIKKGAEHVQSQARVGRARLEATLNRKAKNGGKHRLELRSGDKDPVD